MDYPITNKQIEIYSRVEGRRVYYPRKRLLLWSILGAQVPEEVKGSKDAYVLTA